MSLKNQILINTDEDYTDNEDNFDDETDGDELKCGEVYDFGTKCWNLLHAKYSDFGRYSTFFQAAVMSKDGVEEPTQIVFYDLYRGVTRVLDLASGGTSTPVQRPTGFAVMSFTSKDPIPSGHTDHDDLAVLSVVTHNVRALFANGTFYWFSPTMRLYGYDTLTETWLRSSCLAHRLPKLMFDYDDVQNYPFLIHLPNGKFLLTIQECYGVITMAFLTVRKVENLLDVSVDLLPRFKCTHYKDFVPTEGMAVLLNNTE